MTVTSSSCKLHPRGVAYRAECAQLRTVYVRRAFFLSTLATNLRLAKVDSSCANNDRATSHSSARVGAIFSKHFFGKHKQQFLQALLQRENEERENISASELRERLHSRDSTLCAIRVGTKTNYLTNSLKRKPRSIYANYRCAFCM